jgi:predicted Rossmann fold flavoprotein
MLDLAIIGGGAAGFFAAINAKRKHPNLKVEIFEKSKTVLGKVRISGGGRCNVTHACFDNRTLVSYYPRGNKELLSVFERFNTKDTVKWFESRGIILKSEADGRIFPISDNSETIVNCFLDECDELKIPIKTLRSVKSIQKNGVFQLNINDEIVEARQVLVATGSSDAFWQIIKGLGHKIVDPVPSLFTFNIEHDFIAELMGLSVPRASVKLVLDKQQLKESRLAQSDLTQTGPLLITHWGLSGPAILKLSSIAARFLNQLQYKFTISVGLSNLKLEDTLDLLIKVKSEHPKKQVVNTPLFNIPQRWWQRVHSLTFLNTFNTWSDVSKKDLLKFAEHLSAFQLEVDGKSTFKDEFVTSGGVDLKEVDFKNMQSKVVPGLYFAGEVLNIDALTGGFNFQAAWSEAWVISENL